MLQAPTRGKRRNVEKRREKSRTAARSRREKEAGIFTDLYVTVPIVTESTITHVDRIAVLRLAATLCRVRRVAEKVFPPQQKSIRQEISDLFSESSINECLDGFLLMIDSSGLIIYISPNCSRSLGLTQTDLIGHNLHDYLNNDDSASLTPTLNDAAMNQAQALLRMKSVLSPRGRNLTLKSAVYKSVSFMVKKTVVEFPPIQPRRPLSGDGVVTISSGDISDLEDENDGNASPDDGPVTQLDNTYFVMHGLPMVHCGAGAMGDYHGPGTFMTRHTMDMKFSYCHERLSDYLGYDSKSLMNSSFFALVHPEDLTSLTASLKELFRKGQITTGYYRMMVKSGGFIWVSTSANTVTHSTRGHGGQYVVCVHQLISNVDNQQITADVQQTSPSLLCKMETERKIKHAKIIGPTTEQLLQRAPTVTDYIPLTNPTALPVNALGLHASAMADVVPKRRSQAHAASECDQEWLFRAVGGIESRDARQRGGNGEQCANAAVGTTAKRVHADAAATINSQRSPKAARSTRGGATIGPTDNSMFVPAISSFDPISQADLEHVLFTPLSAPGVHPTTVVGTGGPGMSSVEEPRPDDFSLLAPFIHQTDEILSLDFGSTGAGAVGLPNMADKYELEFADFDQETRNNGAVFLLDEPSPPSSSQEEKVKIESIYRYLRDDEDDFFNRYGPTTEPSGLPPLLIVDPVSNQKNFNSISPYQNQAELIQYSPTSSCSLQNGNVNVISPRYFLTSENNLGSAQYNQRQDGRSANRV